MFERLLAEVAKEVSGGRALETVRTLARHHRVQASPGYDEACEWLAGQLTSFGIETEREEVPGDGRTRCLGHLMPEGWECATARATLHGRGSREILCDYGAERLSLVLRSTAARGRYPLVALEDGTRPADYDGCDVRGRVVLTRGAAQRVHELAVVERGAAGVLFDGRREVPPVRDRFTDPDSLAYTSFWWGEGEPRGWGFVVSPRTGERLRACLRAGDELQLEVHIDARDFPTPIPLLSARLPGRAPGEVLVVAHLCHPQPSANDNASGAAAALESARVLSVLRGRGALAHSGRSVRFLWVPELTGTFAWLSRDTRRAADTLAAVNLDMVGQDQERCGSTLLLEHAPHFAASFAEELLLRVRGKAVDWVPSYSGPGHYSMTRLGEVPYAGGSDHAVFADPAIGVPCPMLIQWPDRYYHSSLDTPDKTSPASLALAVRCAATYASFLATAGPEENRWLLGAVERGARRRLLAAVDEAEPARAVLRERVRGGCALASLARLGVENEAIAGGDRRLVEFAEREAGWCHPAGAHSAPAADPAGESQEVVPARRLAAPIHTQRHLLAGWRALSPERREGWRAREEGQPDGALLCELAWFACDGRRPRQEIARLVATETGRDEPGFVAEFLGLAEALGLVGPASSGGSGGRGGGQSV